MRDTTAPHSPSSRGCGQCLDARPLEFGITMAFQPIIDARTRTVFAYEALVRGTDGAGAGEVLSRVNDENRYTFDQMCRIKVIELAAALDMECRLSINFLPNAVYRPEACIRATIETAEQTGFPIERIIFEVTEAEPVKEPEHLQSIFAEYQHRGFTTAIDDFGAGYAGLNLLARFKPHLIKLDMELCQGIADDDGKRIIAQGVVSTAQALGIDSIAEGIETATDLKVLQALGVHYFQGYLFAKPAVETLPAPDYSAL